jgi:hypothetical protein
LFLQTQDEEFMFHPGQFNAISTATIIIIIERILLHVLF